MEPPLLQLKVLRVPTVRPVTVRLPEEVLFVLRSVVVGEGLQPGYFLLVFGVLLHPVHSGYLVDTPIPPVS